MLLALQFVRPSNNQIGEPWKPQLNAWAQFSRGSFRQQYRVLLEVYPHIALPASNTNSYHTAPEGISNVSQARLGLISSLVLLPKHPVNLENALKVMFERVLRYFSKPSKYDKTDQDKPPIFFKELLFSTIHDFGLIAIDQSLKDKSGKGIVIAPGLGVDWLKNQALEPQDPQASLLVQPNFDIIAYLEELTPNAMQALACADCTRIDTQTATFTITRSSVYRALETGFSVENMIKMLGENSRIPISGNVSSSIREWAGRRERLSLTQHSTLLEYHNSAERDAALQKFKWQAVGTRFALVTQVPKGIDKHRYSSPPSRTIKFLSDGRFTLEGGSDLAARAVLASIAIQDATGKFRIDPQAVRIGRFTNQTREAFIARVTGGIPASLEALLSIWEGKRKAPSIASAILFQHEQAAALAEHPSLKPCFEMQLGPTAWLVKPGFEKQLEKTLKELGIESQKEIRTNLEAVTSGGISSLQMGLDTRKMRVIIENAILENRNLELRYHDEKVTQTRYGYPEKSRGKILTERIQPKHVHYSASTPYFSGDVLEGNKSRTIRIGYILGIAVI